MPSHRHMSEFLREARPTWDEKAVAKAESKLALVDITSVDDLAEALQEKLNARLQKAGLKTFTADTLQALRSCLGVNSHTENEISEVADKNEDTIQQTTDEPEEEAQSENGMHVDGVNGQEHLHIPSLTAVDENVGQNVKHECIKAEVEEHQAAITSKETFEMPEPEEKQQKGDASEDDKVQVQASNAGMATEQLDLDDLDADDLEALAEVSKKGYYHGRPKSEPAPAPQRLDVDPRAAATIAPSGKREEFDEFQRKWDRFDHIEPDLQENATAPTQINSQQMAAPVPAQHRSPQTDDDKAVDDTAFNASPSSKDQVPIDSGEKRFVSDKLKADTEYFCMTDGEEDAGKVAHKRVIQQQESKEDSSKDIREPLQQDKADDAKDQEDASESHKDATTNADANTEYFEGIPDLASLLADLDREDHDDPLLKERAIANGIPLTRLECPERLPSLLDRIERLETMTVSKLQSEYEQRGFIATDELTSRAELVPLVRDVLIWEEMRVPDLVQVCKVRGLDPSEDQQTHAKLMRLLAKPTWEHFGIPVERLSSISDARNVLDQVRALDAGNMSALTAQTLKCGLPVGSRSADELVSQLKQFFVWNQLPVAELEKECQALGVVLEAKTESVSKGALKGELLQWLVLSVWGPTWIKIWRRLGSFELLETLIRQVEHLNGLNISSLQLQYKEYGLPFDKTLEKQVLIDRLRDVLIWKRVPMATLKAECQANAITLSSDCTAEDTERNEAIKMMVLSTWGDSWEAWGIPALRLGSLSHVEDLMNKIDGWRSLAREALRKEFKSTDLPFDSTLDSKNLIDRLKSIWVWRHLPVSELRQECSQHGISADVCSLKDGIHEEATIEDIPSYKDLMADLDAEDCVDMEEAPEKDKDDDLSERGELIRRLVLHAWDDTWKSWGIPAQKLMKLDQISMLMEEVDRLKSMALSALKEEAQTKGVPYDHYMSKQALVGRLKDVLVWSRLSIMDLRRECEVRGAKVRMPFRRDEMIQSLLERVCMLAWEAQDLPVGRLANYAAASRLVGQCEQIECMDRASLVDWYSSMGFAVEKGLEKKELATMLKMVTIWEALPQLELQKECAKHGLSVPEAWTSSVLVQRVVEDEEEQRQKLVHLLLTNQRMKAWETEELPARRIGNVETVIFVRQQLKNIDNMRLSELESWYEGTHLPKEKGMTRSEIAKLLKLVTVWDALPMDELLKECSKRDIPVNDSDQAVEDDERKRQLHIQLLLHERILVWEAKGFQARRVGNTDSIIQLVHQYEHFKTLNVKDLQKTYNEAGLPEDANLGRDDLLNTLLIVLTWEMLPVAELQKDCQVRNLPITIEDGAAGADDAKDFERWELIRRLKVDLIVKMNKGWYEDRGIPVMQLSPLQIADLSTRFTEIDGMSLEDLLQWYESTGLPKEKDLERMEIQKLLKKVTLWNVLSLPELRKECEKSQVEISKSEKSSSNEDQRHQMGVQLLLKERMDAWDAKGFQAHRLGNVDTVLQAMHQYSHFESLEDKELFGMCSKAGLPSQTGIPRDEVLKKLKIILIWELLPLAELRKDCRERNVPSQQGKPTERQESIRWLTLSTWNNTWAPRGVPAERLGNLEVANSIIEEYDRLHAGVMYSDMVGKGAAFLQSQYKKLGIPYDPDLGKEQHINRLRDLYIWQYLPVAELRAEAKKYGAWAFSQGNVDERSELIKRLVLSGWTETWQVRAIPAKRLASLEVAQALIEQVDRLRSMSFIDLRTECQSKGVRIDPHMDREVTWNRLKDLLVWRSLPVPELQRECMDRGLAVNQAPAPPTRGARGGLTLAKAALALPRPGDAHNAHNNLVRRLLDYTYLKEWDDQGIPVLQLEDARVPIQILEQVDAMSESELRRWYRQAGFPDDWGITKKELNILLKKVNVWHTLTLEKLQKECTKCKLQVGTFREQKHKLIEMLLARERMNAWQAQGFPVERVGNLEGMITLVAAYRQADQMSLSDLKSWYKSTGLPEEKELQRDELVALLKGISLWNVLPLGELQQECAENNVTHEFLEETPDDEKRHKLGVLLLLEARMDVWEAKGYQARRMGEAETVLSAVHRLEEFRSMSDDEFDKTYKEIGLPHREGMQRADRLNTMKTVLIWELLPLPELIKDCKERGLSLDMGNEGKTTEERHAELLHRLRVDLVVNMTKDDLEKRGVPVDRLGSLQAARVASQFDHFEALSNEELKTTFKDAGFPVESMMERSHLLKTVKTVVVWEMLPLQELQKDCLELELPIQTKLVNASDADRCGELAERLRMDLCVKMNCTWYEQKGIPIDQVSTLKAVQVAQQFAKFDDMSVRQLLRAHLDLGMPIDHSMSKADLLSRLREATLWKATKLDRLKSECEARGIKLSMRYQVQGVVDDDDICDELLDMLLFKICESTFRALEVPIERFKSCKAANDVAEEWSKIEKATEAELLERYTDLGVSPQFMGWKELRERLKTAATWKHLTLKDLQDLCRAHDVYGFNTRDTKTALVSRLAKKLWPPKPNPKPKPKPKPKPVPPPPPPPRPPPQTSFFKISKYFQTLELPYSASIEDVKKAYRKLALKYHPDKNSGPGQKLAAQAFREVAEAYEKLSEHLRMKNRWDR